MLEEVQDGESDSGTRWYLCDPSAPAPVLCPPMICTSIVAFVFGAFLARDAVDLRHTRVNTQQRVFATHLKSDSPMPKLPANMPLLLTPPREAWDGLIKMISEHQPGWPLFRRMTEQVNVHTSLRVHTSLSRLRAEANFLASPPIPYGSTLSIRPLNGRPGMGLWPPTSSPKR